MNYDFTGKSIKCETWEQMLHLSELAEAQGAKNNGVSLKYYMLGNIFFVCDEKGYDCCVKEEGNTEISYTDFIPPQLPTETIEVNGCGDCPMYREYYEREFDQEWHNCISGNVAKTIDGLFSTCPLKTKSITIKLKTNDTTGN